MSLSDRERAIRQKLKDEFPHFAERCLHIKPKSGGAPIPLLLNRAQRYVHDRLEEQRAKTGRVRALLLKARQQGFSTYVAGRFYWKAIHRRGCQVFILTHEQDATDNLFGMVDRYHEHNHPLLKPSTGASNAKELRFDQLDSGYSVGTAGSKAVGRSKTVQLFHGSEVAFWPNAATHFAGVVQAIPDLPETEIVLESTANGVGGEFHERWQQAEAGIGDYQAIFVPWYWSDEYQRRPEPDFRLTDEEREHAAQFDLSNAQMCWRRAKIAELKDEVLFKQEYPATAAEAFQMSGHDSFIKPELVMAARKNRCEARGPLILGVDPARFGGDRFSVAFRCGRRVKEVRYRTDLDVVSGAGWIKTLIDNEKPEKVFIDVGGLGVGIYDIIRGWGMKYEAVVQAVNFGSPPITLAGLENGGPKNRRAEMWQGSRDWLAQPGGVQIPDEDGLQADACGPKYRHDDLGRLLLESKEEMRKRGLRSPDGWDAVALTFAEPVYEDAPAEYGGGYHSSESFEIPNFGAV